jgi:hypothetical protein
MKVGGLLVPLYIYRIPEMWRRGHGAKEMETWKHGDMETWRHENMEKWTHGEMETGRHQTENGKQKPR